MADAKIFHSTPTAFGEADKIILSSEEIPNPKFVRYAWADAPINPNLINKEGLPAVPSGRMNERNYFLEEIGN